MPDQQADINQNIVLDLTAYEHDDEDSGTSLAWYVTGSTHATVSGEYSDDDLLTFTPDPGFSGQVTVTLHLVDSGSLEATQNLVLTWGEPASTPTPTAPDAPVITSQPQSQTIASGQSVTLYVEATSAAPLSYQWYQGTVPDMSQPVGANLDSLTTPALTTTTSYWVRVSNSGGHADSATAIVTVEESPACGSPTISQPTKAGPMKAEALSTVTRFMRGWSGKHAGIQPAATISRSIRHPIMFGSCINSEITDTGGNSDALFGLVEALSGAQYGLAGFPTGFFVSMAHDTLGIDHADPLVTYSDRPSYWSWNPYDASTYINLGGVAVWRQVDLTIDHLSWTLSVYTDQGSLLGQLTGTLPAQHSSYAYLMLFRDQTSGWEYEQGLLDDIEVYTSQPTIPPTIAIQPQSQTISSGQTATLSVVATGVQPLTFQWYQGVSPDTSNPVGTNAFTFTTPPLTTTTSYWVHVSNDLGSVDSDTATITVETACYTLATSANPRGYGTVTVNTASNCSGGRYVAGTVVQMTANPATGYNFAEWTGDASGTSNPTTVTMTSNRSVTANFTEAMLKVGDTFEDNGGNIYYFGNWGMINDASYSGGSMHFTGEPNASLSFRLSGAAGSRLTIYRSTGPDRGNMQVCLGIGVCQTFSNYSLIPLTQQPLTILLPITGTLLVTLTNQGTAGQYMDFDVVSLFASPSALTVGNAFQDGDINIRYSGQWISNSSASYDGGTVMYTGFPNNSYTFLITANAGDRLKIVRTVGPGKGEMRVCFSEMFACQTVSNSNPITLYQQPFTVGVPWTGTYPVTVTFTGSDGEYLDVDKLTLQSAATILTVGNSFQDGDPNLTYNGVWITASNATYDGGTVMYTGQTGASVSFMVTVSAGDRLQITRSTESQHGTMQVCIGAQCSTYSNYSQINLYQQQLNLLMSNAGTFLVSITNLAPAGQYLDFDAVRLLSPPTPLSLGTTYQEDSSSLIYSGQWIASSDPSYSGGQVYYTGQPDASVSFMVNGVAGNYLVIYRTKSSDKGAMQVCFSQIYNCQTISNSDPTKQYQRPISILLPWTATYPVTIRFVGTQGQYLDLDKLTLSSVQVLSQPDTPTPKITEGVTQPPNQIIMPTLELPTALPFPTLELPTNIPSLEPPQTLEPLPLPAYASMDDSAPDWAALSGWTLTTDAAFGGRGLGWQVSANNQADVLRWNRAIDLTAVQPGQLVQLSFESLLTSAESTALVQVSADGINWTTLGTAAPIGQWTQMTYDLSAFVGQQVQLQFVWQGVMTDKQKPDSWWVDEVSVAAVAPIPTATDLPTPILTPTVAVTATEAPTPEPSATPTEAVTEAPPLSNLGS